jgi:hypothetical protein
MVQKSNKSEKSASKSLKDFSLPPLPFAHQIKGEENKEKKVKEVKDDDVVTLSTALKMIEEMKAAQDKIDHMLSEIYQLTGWTPKYLKSYLENPNNFSKEEWQNIQKQRKEFTDLIKTPKELETEKKTKKDFINQESSSQSQIVKERRTKTAGARRKWLPMR